MIYRKWFSRLLILASVLAMMSIAAQFANSQEESGSSSKREWQQVSDMAANKDLDGLVKLREAINSHWAGRTDARLSLTCEICKQLNSIQFSDARAPVEARRYAKEVLEDHAELPVGLEMDMVSLLQEVEEYRLGSALLADWTQDRRERVEYLRKFVERVNRDYDPYFDFGDLKNQPLGNVCVPAPNYMCGIRPEDVKEPEVRKRYQAAIDANAAKAKKYNYQLLLGRINERLPKFVDQFVIGMYSQKPKNLNELERVLSSLGITDGRRSAILENVDGAFR